MTDETDELASRMSLESICSVDLSAKGIKGIKGIKPSSPTDTDSSPNEDLTQSSTTTMKLYPPSCPSWPSSMLEEIDDWVNHVQENLLQPTAALWTKSGINCFEPTLQPDNPYLAADMQTELRNLGNVLEPCVFQYHHHHAEEEDHRIGYAVFNATAAGSPQALRQTQARLWEGCGILDARYTFEPESSTRTTIFDGENHTTKTALNDLFCLSNTPVFAAGTYNQVRIVNGLVVRTSRQPVFSASCSKPHMNGKDAIERGARSLFRRKWEDSNGEDGIDRDSAVCQIVAHWTLSSLGVTPPLLFAGIVPLPTNGSAEHIVQITPYKGETLSRYMDSFHSRMIRPCRRGPGGRPKLDELVKVWELIEEAVDKMAAAGYLHLELHSGNILVESDPRSADPARVWLIDVSVSDVLYFGVDAFDPDALKTLMLMQASKKFMAWTEAICNEFAVVRRDVPWVKPHRAVLLTKHDNPANPSKARIDLARLLGVSKQEWPFPAFEEEAEETIVDTDMALHIRSCMIHFFIDTDMPWMAEQVLLENGVWLNGTWTRSDADVDAGQVFDAEFFSHALRTRSTSERSEEYAVFVADVVWECITWAFDHLLDASDDDDDDGVDDAVDGDPSAPSACAANPSTLQLCAALCVLNAPSNGVSYHLKRSGRPGVAKKRKL